MGFICPVCSEELISNGKSLICENGHLFDISKKGYVNLLLNRSGKIHGDSDEMVKARSEFLDKGYYEKLKSEIISVMMPFKPFGCIEDCGCGECYYTSAIKEAFPDAEIMATDISTAALRAANRRNKQIRRAAASTFSLPIGNNSADAALNIFSPFVKDEYFRTLKKGGLLIMVIPLENHLWELKKFIYDKPYKNEPHDTHIDGFDFMGEKKIEYTALLPQNDLMNLFKMTPYFIKTSSTDKNKLNEAESLRLTFSFGILTYKKI